MRNASTSSLRNGGVGWYQLGCARPFLTPGPRPMTSTTPVPGERPAVGGDDFMSDNGAGLCPEARDALVAAADGVTPAYGDDDHTARAAGMIRDLLGGDGHAGAPDVFFVVNGTAANTLATASLTRPWERVLCEHWAHLNQDESTAPELFSGARVTPIDRDGHKLTPDDLDDACSATAHGVHHPAPGVVSITNATEHGEVYTPDEVAAIAERAHHHGYRLHMDGARFANAVAALDCDPADLAANAGVDALSFGGTKNGLAMGEAVVFFGDAGRAAAERFPWIRKRAGHLLSKMRYLAAPFAAALDDGAWLRHASHANTMARRLSDGLSERGVGPRFPTEANGVFVALPDEVVTGLRDRAWGFHMMGDPQWRQYRFMASFATTSERVDALLADVETVLADLDAVPADVG